MEHFRYAYIITIQFYFKVIFKGLLQNLRKLD